MNTNMRLDNYYMSFFDGDSEYAALKDAQKELESNSSWDEGIRSMKVHPLETPMDVEILASDPTNHTPKEILLDTSDNSGLRLEYGGKVECLRDCAMPSLLSTAGISGPGVSRTSKGALASGLTSFLTGCREKTQVLIRAGKVSAVLSDRYERMPISELLQICDDLEESFGTMEFQGGMVTHSLTMARFSFPKAVDDTSIAYNAALAVAGRSTKEAITPIVEFRASDTSGEAARLLTYLQIGNSSTALFPIGEGVKVIHVRPREYDENGSRISCMEKFRQECKLLFPKLGEFIQELIPEMLKCTIQYPGNALIGLCKYANIPQKWGGIAEDQIRLSYADSPCTFLDLYSAITEVTAYAIRDGFSPVSSRILDLEEGILKIAKNKSKWKQYDLPGSVSWSQR